MSVFAVEQPATDITINNFARLGKSDDLNSFMKTNN